jgi:hypothetical protein
MEALAGDAACNLLHLMYLVFRLLGRGQDLLDFLPLDCAVQVVGRCVIGVELAEGGDDAAVKIANDVVANADGESHSRSEWARRIDHALDKLVHAHNNQLAVGAGRRLANVIEDGMRLVGVAGTEDRED